MTESRSNGSGSTSLPGEHLKRVAEILEQKAKMQVAIQAKLNGLRRHGRRVHDRQSGALAGSCHAEVWFLSLAGGARYTDMAAAHHDS